jgi:hypothetical protein
VFSQRCGPVGYRVKGPIAQDQHSVTVKGLAPYVDSECRVSGGHESVLVFELIE